MRHKKARVSWVLWNRCRVADCLMRRHHLNLPFPVLETEFLLRYKLVLPTSVVATKNGADLVKEVPPGFPTLGGGMIGRTQAAFESLAWVNEKATMFLLAMLTMLGAMLATPAACLGILGLPSMITKLKTEFKFPLNKGL